MTKYYRPTNKDAHVYNSIQLSTPVFCVNTNCASFVLALSPFILSVKSELQMYVNRQ